LLVVSLLAWSGAAWAQTKMTIATGVDPVFSAYYVAQQEGLFK
jgi:ABC-type nitrate/sulfonate/bicarbonate transport system substrate-binding protein